MTFSEHAEKVLVFNGRHPLVAEHLAEMERLYEGASRARDVLVTLRESETARAERAEAALAAAQQGLRIVARTAADWRDRAAAGGDETA